jgi:hypothetical protein
VHRYSWSPALARLPGPEQPKPLPMPSNQPGRLHHGEHATPIDELRGSRLPRVVSASLNATMSACFSSGISSASSIFTRIASPPRFCRCRFLANSTKILLIICAATARKCARFCPLHSVYIDKSEIRFVHQRRCLERMIRTFLAHVPSRKAVELLIDEWNEPVERRAVPVAPGAKELSGVGLWMGGHDSFSGRMAPS